VGFSPAKDWAHATEETRGYESNESVQDFLDRARAFENEFSDAEFVSARFLPLALAMLHCIRDKNEPGTMKLSVLDVGGAFGEYFYWARKTFPYLELKWDILETSSFAHSANQCLGPSPITWKSSIESCAPKYDLAILSSVLQYVPEPLSFLKPITHICSNLIINRLPLTKNGHDEVAIQNVRNLGRKLSYPTHFLDEKLFIATSRPRLDSFSLGRTRRPSYFPISANCWSGFVIESS